jgi:putative transcriptional regulator
MGVDPTGAEGTVRVHLGGPVRPNIGFVLHSADYTGEDTIVVDDAMALTAGGKVFRAMVDGKGPKQSLIALGYAGWAPGQLEGEIAAGSWSTVPADLDVIFDDDYAGKWRRALALHRIDL